MNLDLNLKFCNLTILNNYTNSPHKALSLPTGKFINLSLKIFCFEVLTKEKTFSLQSLENLHFLKVHSLLFLALQRPAYEPHVKVALPPVL